LEIATNNIRGKLFKLEEKLIAFSPKIFVEKYLFRLTL